MSAKKRISKSNMPKINVENEILILKRESEAFYKELYNLNKKLTMDLKLANVQDKKNIVSINRLNVTADKLEKTKDEILGYTLRIITTVVGFLGLILSISYLAINKPADSNFLWFCLGIILFFSLIFTIWFLFWMKNNDIKIIKSKPKKLLLYSISGILGLSISTILIFHYYGFIYVFYEIITLTLFLIMSILLYRYFETIDQSNSQIEITNERSIK